MNNKKKSPIKKLESLITKNLIPEKNISELQPVIENFSLSITHQMAEQIDRNNPHDPIAKQFLPDVQELKFLQEENADPIGDDTHTKVKGIVHRYPDRLLLMPVYVCPVYCRFCFRKEKISSSNETLSQADLNIALNYIEQEKNIWEVILTGGDPLILKPKSLKNIIERLNKIDHVEIIRIHTRVPVVDSARIDDELIAALKSQKTIYIVLHANHPNEFSDAATLAIKKIIDAGIPMLSQSVLLKNINDDIDTLSQLMRLFVKHRIKPYYLHHADLARGTSHFRTSIAEGQKLLKELRKRISGLCQPLYVLDIPGGHGKVPIGPHYISFENQKYKLSDFQCQIHDYTDIIF